VLAVPRQQQERPGQPFLTGVEQPVDQLLLDPYVPRQHVRDEPIRERRLLVQEAHQLIFVHEEDGAVRGRGRTPHADDVSRAGNRSILGFENLDLVGL